MSVSPSRSLSLFPTEYSDSKSVSKEELSLGDDVVAYYATNTLRHHLEEHGLELTHERDVRWARKNKHHPRNWHWLRKTYDIGLVIFLDFYTTSISTAGSAAANASRDEFGLSTTLALFCFISVYLIGQAAGGVIFPPYSEAFGRKWLYVMSTAVYSVGCITLATAPHISVVVLSRLVMGLMSSIPTIVVAGSIEDIFDSESRIWLIFAWAIAANTGLVVGPIVSTYVSYYLGWRWNFWIASIVTGVAAVLMLGIQESRPSLLLKHKVEALRMASGDTTLQPLDHDHIPDFRTFIRVGLFRPIHLYFTEPIVFLVATLSAIAFATVYLFTEALPLVYESLGFNKRAASLPFLAIAIGLLFGVFTRLYDHFISIRCRQQHRRLLPEDKLLGFSIGAPVLALALWWFAWTIPPTVHVSWTVSAVALIFIGFALNEFDAVLAGYLADSYLSYAASGFGALSLLRSLLSAAFPLFAKQMFEGFGQNGAASVLAGVATLFCVVPPLFSRYGEQIRFRSKFARFSSEVYERSNVDERLFEQVAF